MVPISLISDDQLQEDRIDCLHDIEICKIALIHGNSTYGANNNSTQERLEGNQKIVEVIEAELRKRGIEF